jgi:hypothetical protein
MTNWKTKNTGYDFLTPFTDFTEGTEGTEYANF